MGFSRQVYLSGLPCPPPEYLPDPGIELLSLVSSALQQILYPLGPGKASEVCFGIKTATPAGNHIWRL